MRAVLTLLFLSAIHSALAAGQGSPPAGGANPTQQPAAGTARPEPVAFTSNAQLAITLRKIQQDGELVVPVRNNGPEAVTLRVAIRDDEGPGASKVLRLDSAALTVAPFARAEVRLLPNSTVAAGRYTGRLILYTDKKLLDERPLTVFVGPPAPTPLVPNWTLRAYSLPLTSELALRRGDDLPIEKATADLVKIRPTLLQGDSGGVVWLYSEGKGNSIRDIADVAALKGIRSGGVGKYTGKIDLDPTTDAGEVKLNVIVSHRWYLAAFAIAFGVIAAWALQFYVGIGRTVLQLRSELLRQQTRIPTPAQALFLPPVARQAVADVQKEIDRIGTYIRQLSVPSTGTPGPDDPTPEKVRAELKDLESKIETLQPLIDNTTALKADLKRLEKGATGKTREWADKCRTLLEKSVSLKELSKVKKTAEEAADLLQGKTAPAEDRAASLGRRGAAFSQALGRPFRKSYNLIWLLDWSMVVIALAFAILTGLNELYFGRAYFGTPRDYVTAVVWGFGAKTGLDLLRATVARLQPKLAG